MNVKHGKEHRNTGHGIAPEANFLRGRDTFDTDHDAVRRTKNKAVPLRNDAHRVAEEKRERYGRDHAEQSKRARKQKSKNGRRNSDANEFITIFVDGCE